MSSRADFARDLVRDGVLVGLGAPGLYGRGPTFMRVAAAIEAAIDRASSVERARHVAFPPLIPRDLLRKVGYIESFPQLCGSIHAFAGTERELGELVTTVNAGGDWGPHLAQTDLVLLPAACYPLYPTLTGTLPDSRVVFDFTGHCFRNEPSDDPARMQYFQVREKVCIGREHEVLEWREHWSERALALLASMELEAQLAPASDPFFGRGGRLMKESQQSMGLKHELLVRIFGADAPTAVASFNHHQESFARAFDIRLPGGALAQTACVGFGVDRIAIALLRKHGTDPERWSPSLLSRLWP